MRIVFMATNGVMGNGMECATQYASDLMRRGFSFSVASWTEGVYFRVPLAAPLQYGVGPVENADHKFTQVGM